MSYRVIVENLSAGPTVHHLTKLQMAHFMLAAEPEKWMRGSAMDERDVALIKAPQLPFVDYEKRPYLRKVYHMKRGEQFGVTNWIVETDNILKKMVKQDGGELVGYGSSLGDIPAVDWISMTINVNMYYRACAYTQNGNNWGFISTNPANIRIFKGPPETCDDHPWDAMILRNCTQNTIGTAQFLQDKAWDLLLMKMCEDYDHPWVLVAMREVSNDFEKPPCPGHRDDDLPATI